MKLILLLFSNNKSVMSQYLVYYIIYKTYITNDRRITTISIFYMYNDTLQNVREMNSFGGHFGKLHMHSTGDNVDYFHPIFLNIENIF